MVQEIFVWVFFGAAIGTIAHVVSTRASDHAWYVEAVLGSFVALVSGGVFFAAGAPLVERLSVFTIDPVAFYAALTASATALVFFIGLDLVLSSIQIADRKVVDGFATIGGSRRVTTPAYAKGRSH